MGDAQGSPLLNWRLCGENKSSKDICSLRPFENNDMILVASGQKKADGTPIILRTHIDKWVCPSAPVPDGPMHSEFRFIPTDAPAGATAPGTPKTPADGWYSLRPASDTSLILRAYTANYRLGDPITVFKSKGAYGRTEVVFWELGGDEIPETSGWDPAAIEPSALCGSSLSFMENQVLG